MPSQRDVRNKINSVKNIQKITRAMEMVAAARLRRAEQRIEALRPYAEGISRMTRQAVRAAGVNAMNVPLLVERDSETNVALLLVTGDRGLAGAFNSQVIRAGVREGRQLAEQGRTLYWYATGRRGVSSLTFRGNELSGAYTGFMDRPAYADARTIADDLTQTYVDGGLDRVDIIYNSYVSPLTQRVTHQQLLPVAQGRFQAESDEQHAAGAAARDSLAGPDSGEREVVTSVEYEPDAKEILRRLVPDFIEISIYRALVESAAGFFGAQMTAMRSASENAGEILTDLTLQMNRARQAEITQEIMEVVAGAEGLS